MLCSNWVFSFICFRPRALLKSTATHHWFDWHKKTYTLIYARGGKKTHIMPVVSCPIPDCRYTTPDLEAAIVAALITAHSTVHTAGPAAKVEQVKRPTVAAAGSSEEWAYFLSRWNDYVAATKVTGRDRVIQLLECCDEPLRRDLTRSAGGSLTGKPVDDILAAIKTLAVREEFVLTLARSGIGDKM